MTLRDAVEGEYQFVEVAVFQCWTRAFDKCCDVVWVLVEWRKQRGLEVWLELAHGFHHVHHGGLIAGHRVVRIHRHDQYIVDTLLEQLLQCALGGR